MSTQGMGKGMIIASWVLLLGLLTLLFNEALVGRNNPNQQLQTVAGGGGVGVVLKRNRGGHYVATGQINGNNVTFLVDTGATMVAVPEGLALQLGLKKGVRQSSSTANGWTHTWSTVIDEVRLGPIVERNVRASILPNMPGNEVLLGMTFLKDMELVQRDGKLKITSFSTQM